MNGELEMKVSPICVRDGEKYAFVSFQDKERMAEGKIPACKILTNKGFSEEEVRGLEEYMQQNLAMLKRMSAEIRMIDAFMK